EENENFGKMFCWHRRYSLGDKHDYKESDDFLIDLLNKTVPQNKIFQMIIDNKFERVRFEPDEKDKQTYHLKSYSDYFKHWYVEDTYEDLPFDKQDEIVDTAAQFFTDSELLGLIREYNVILPLYLYDHGGITMSCEPFSCRWDSFQCGWIYADYEMIKHEYGEVTPETLEKAEDLLHCEVKEYDHYITGQCYGFKLYEGDNQIESCWGFIGEISDVSKNIKEYLPSACKNIVDSLEYQYDIDEEEYLEQTLEDEDDMEI
ncbi:MAG: hypothetical protein FWD23_17215, partial [Oscillospiraceae bacterium]|nr:hypothetical protein [Oscillospiraceae bacterium]